MLFCVILVSRQLWFIITLARGVFDLEFDKTRKVLLIKTNWHVEKGAFFEFEKCHDER